MLIRIEWKDGNSCFDCKHFKVELVTDKEIRSDFPNCAAFPNGIPKDVIRNGHDKPRPDLGQKNKVVFEK